MKRNLAILTLSVLVLTTMAAKIGDGRISSNSGLTSTYTFTGQFTNGKSAPKSASLGKLSSSQQQTQQSYEVTIGGTGSSEFHRAPARPEDSRTKIQEATGRKIEISASSKQQIALAGGFTLIPNIQQNKEALAALEYLQQHLCPLLSTTTLVQSSQQIVNGINYQFIFQLQLGLNKRTKYFIQLYKPFTGKYQITKSQYYELSKPKLEEFVHFESTNSKSINYMDLINDQVLFQLKDLFNGKAQLADFDIRPPYYIVNYRVGKSDLFRVEIIYDVVINAANILSVSKQTVTQSTLFTKSTTQASFPSQKQTPTTSTVAVTPVAAPAVASRSQQTATRGGNQIRQAGVYVKEKIIRQNPIPQLAENPIIGTAIQVKPAANPIKSASQPKPTIVLTKGAGQSLSNQKAEPSIPAIVIHSKPSKPTTPSFTIAQNNERLLGKLSGISDPALIPFLTSSQTTNSKQVEEVVKFIIEKVKITSDFTIVLINQIKYGIRIIIQMKDDHKLFEAVVTSDNQAPQILAWRRISTISDADPDVFTQYFRINPDEDLKTLIRSIFKGEDMIRRFKDILSAEKKVSYDGIYYRFILQSTSSNRFLVKFYYIPDKKYNQIIHYELLDNKFDAKSQTRLSSIPENDPNFKKAQDYLFKNYANVLKDASVSFVSTYTIKNFVYYRLVFVGLNGKYEAVLMVGLETGDVLVCRWEKMEDGYVPVQLEKLKNNDEFKSIRVSIKEYIQNKFKLDAQVNYLEVKNIPGFNSFYKFIFERPFPFVLSLQERDSDHSLYIRGLQRVPIAPANEYYNDRIFAGYSSLKLSELQFDDVYQVFYTVLQRQTQVRDGNSEAVAAFRMKTPQGLYYKIIYKINGNQYLACFSYIFVQAEYKLLSFESYLRSVEEGDYRWKCSQSDSKSATCNRCQANNLLTAGRCYKRINGCSLQLASSCHVCEPGFIRTHQLCQVSSQKAIPIPAPLSSTQKIIVTSSGPKTVIYENGNDQNCLKYSNIGCLKCSNRFYIRNGVCKKIQDQCEEYTENGVCTRCYEGYYLNNQYCIALDPLCAEADNNGVCTRCYKNYVNVEGKCYIRSNVEITSTSNLPKDQLCLEWSGNQCSKCQFGCYLSRKTSKCTIKDPFCQEFDMLFEECSVCNRGYKKNAGLCERNT